MLSVLKIGGSVLRDEPSYGEVAGYLAQRLARAADARLVVIVSARHGVTDALLADARSIAREPNAAALDLLWSTGELASVARLALHLQARGIAAAALNVHQTGLTAGSDGVPRVRPRRLLEAITRQRLVVVPGFLGVDARGGIASLGRGGSDLTAVLLAEAVAADACELVKDVGGYFTADPHRDAAARHLPELGIAAALAMADAGCDLIQRAALAAADRAGLPLVVGSLSAAASVTHVQPRSHHGIRHQDHSRGAAVRA